MVFLFVYWRCIKMAPDDVTQRSFIGSYITLRDINIEMRYFCCGSLLLLVLADRIYTLVHLLCEWHILVKFRQLDDCLGKSCSFGLPRVSFVNCCQFMYLIISHLVLRAGYGIWLYQFLIIAYLFKLFLFCQVRFFFFFFFFLPGK